MVSTAAPLRTQDQDKPGSHESQEERRRFPRVKAPIFFQIPRLRDEHRPVLDVSLGGLRVYSDDGFQVGERFQLELLLPPDGTEISALAQVAWVERLPPDSPARYDVGFELLIVDDDGLRLLGRALEGAPPV
ncbi:MAG: PilZ domain-containing protein [Myxococcales bacterium]|nr:PilZ domain-containing protein [Myxococcales bacterium]MCB9649961.1 PilZ domain-containing protein [Deltaproteobacteria bacterium]